MTKKNHIPDRERAMALKALPIAIREQLTPEEMELFLNGQEWPESLFKKLEEFIVPTD
ncbi:MAG: hypothetical protein RBR67_10800 [Desulfobacterium sp.]|nr:hypothetical protein [Desulfobacterium sp.]